MKKIQKHLWLGVLLCCHLICASSASAVIKGLTYNVWGLPIAAPDTETRIEEICKILKTGYYEEKWDFVFLQEVWMPQSRKTLKQCGFPHSVDEDRSGSFIHHYDSGLMILSRYPIIEKIRKKYKSNGSWWNFRLDGEYAAAKSGLFAKIAHPDGNIWIANTHLVARHGHEPYVKQREEQFKTLVNWTKEISHELPFILGET